MSASTFSTPRHRCRRAARERRRAPGSARSARSPALPRRSSRAIRRGGSALASPVMIEDILATEASARLACRLEGGLVLRLGGGARLRIDSAVLRGPEAGVTFRDLGVGGPLLIDRPPAPDAPPDRRGAALGPDRRARHPRLGRRDGRRRRGLRRARPGDGGRPRRPRHPGRGAGRGYPAAALRPAGPGCPAMGRSPASPVHWRSSSRRVRGNAPRPRPAAHVAHSVPAAAAGRDPRRP